MEEPERPSPAATFDAERLRLAATNALSRIADMDDDDYETYEILNCDAPRDDDPVRFETPIEPHVECFSTDVMRTHADLDIPHVGYLLGTKHRELNACLDLAKAPGRFFFGTEQEMMAISDPAALSGFIAARDVLEHPFLPNTDADTTFGQHAAPYYHIVQREIDFQATLKEKVVVAFMVKTNADVTRVRNAFSRVRHPKLAFTWRSPPGVFVDDDGDIDPPDLLCAGSYLNEASMLGSWGRNVRDIAPGVPIIGWYLDVKSIAIRHNVEEPMSKPSMSIRAMDPTRGVAGSATVVLRLRRDGRVEDRVYEDFNVPSGFYVWEGYDVMTRHAVDYVKTCGDDRIKGMMSKVDLEAVRVVQMRPEEPVPDPPPWPTRWQAWEWPKNGPKANRGKPMQPLEMLLLTVGDNFYAYKLDGKERLYYCDGVNLYYSERDGSCFAAPWAGPKFAAQVEVMNSGIYIVDVIRSPKSPYGTFAERWRYAPTIARWSKFFVQRYGDSLPWKDASAVPSDGLVVQPRDAGPFQRYGFGSARYVKNDYTIDLRVVGHVPSIAEYHLRDGVDSATGQSYDAGKIKRYRPDKTAPNPPEHIRAAVTAITEDSYREHHATLEKSEPHILRAIKKLDRRDTFARNLERLTHIEVVAILHPRFAEHASAVSAASCVPCLSLTYPRRFRAKLIGYLTVGKDLPLHLPSWLAERFALMEAAAKGTAELSAISYDVEEEPLEPEGSGDVFADPTPPTPFLRRDSTVEDLVCAMDPGIL